MKLDCRNELRRVINRAFTSAFNKNNNRNTWQTVDIVYLKSQFLAAYNSICLFQNCYVCNL